MDFILIFWYMYVMGFVHIHLPSFFLFILTYPLLSLHAPVDSLPTSVLSTLMSLYVCVRTCVCVPMSFINMTHRSMKGYLW